MRDIIISELKGLSEEKYREFSDAIIPGQTNILGVRLPDLRRLAKKYSGKEYANKIDDYIKQDSYYFEEKMMKALIIGYFTEKDKDVERALDYLDGFADQIDNWSVCDSFCNTFKVIRNDLDTSWKHLQQYVESDKEFEVRIGLILILNHFVKCDDKGRRIPRKRIITTDMLQEKDVGKGKYEDRILHVLNREYNQGYYAMMAAAWTTAEMFVTFPAGTYRMIKESKMDNATYKKSIQKICESLTPSKEVKDIMRRLRYK